VRQVFLKRVTIVACWFPLRWTLFAACLQYPHHWKTCAPAVTRRKEDCSCGVFSSCTCASINF